MDNSTRQYHITFGISKRLVTLKENDNLMNVIENTFKVNSSDVTIQQWSTEWDDWIDVSLIDLPESAKLKIEIKQATEPVLDVDNGQNDAPSEVTIQATYDLDASTDSESFVLPVEYFTPGLLDCLMKGEVIEKSKRNQLLNILYDVMSRKKLYPSKEDYRDVAEQLVKKFPALSTGIGMNDAVSLWRTGISEKFRSERKKEKKKKGMKRCREMENPETTKEESPQNTWGIPVKNFLPPRADGESNDSIEAHVKWLKLEYKKLTRDNQLIEQKMDLTFPERRRLIVSESATVKTLKYTYPCLFEDDQFLAEFGRLLSCNVEDVFLQNLRKFGPTIVKLTTRTKFGKNLMERLAAESNGVTRENIAAKALPELIAALVNEKSSCILRSISDESVVHPVILYEGKCPLDAIRVQINWNNEKICDAVDIPRAVILLIATYFLFGIEYPKEGHTTLQLIQHLLCNISSSAKKTKKFLRNVNLITASITE